MSDEPCPYVTGTVTRYCTLTPFTLTDEEREAVECAMWDYGQYADEMGLSAPEAVEKQVTLRGLLERLR